MSTLTRRGLVTAAVALTATLALRRWRGRRLEAGIGEGPPVPSHDPPAPSPGSLTIAPGPPDRSPPIEPLPPTPAEEIPGGGTPPSAERRAEDAPSPRTARTTSTAAQASSRPGSTVWTALSDQAPLRFVYIPGGPTLIGRPVPGDGLDREHGEEDELPQHLVTLEPFAIATTALTRAQHAAMLQIPLSGPGDRPATGLSWQDVLVLCDHLSAREGRRPAYAGISEAGRPRYRLPTEAEWEHACRAGTTTSFWSGEDEEDLRRVAVYGSLEAEPPTVASRPANPWGLHDMHGGVWEWSSSRYDANGWTEPPGGRPNVRALRGGAWRSAAAACRSANRWGLTTNTREGVVGVRLVLPLS